MYDVVFITFENRKYKFKNYKILLIVSEVIFTRKELSGPEKGGKNVTYPKTIAQLTPKNIASYFKDSRQKN